MTLRWTGGVSGSAGSFVRVKCFRVSSLEANLLMGPALSSKVKGAILQGVPNPPGKMKPFDP